MADPNEMNQDNNPLNDSLDESANHLAAQARIYKEQIMERLDAMRESIQPQLFETERPERNPLVQRANFLYALMFKIKKEFKKPADVRYFIEQLEDQYPLAKETIDEVKRIITN